MKTLEEIYDQNPTSSSPLMDLAGPERTLRHWIQKVRYFSLIATLPAFLAATGDHESAAADARPSNETSSADGDIPGPLKMRGQRRRPLPDFLRQQHEYKLPHQAKTFDVLRPMSGADGCPGTAIPGGNYTNLAPFLDSGDTTGADNTVGKVHDINYSYYNYITDGPDHVYAFTLTGRGPNPRIEVAATSANYRPLIYVLHGGVAQRCPTGIGVSVFNEMIVNDSRWGGGTQSAVLFGGQINFLPLNVPLHLFIDSRLNDPAGSGRYTLRMEDVVIAPIAPAAPRPKFDFDGDARADISVFRPSDRTFYIDRSGSGPTGAQFGLATDKVVPADFDGDGKTDIAVFRDGQWFWLNSSNGAFRQAGWGVAGDIPQPADYTGDGRAELAVFRRGTWFVYNLATGAAISEEFGLPTDRPVAADYDGDGLTQFAVFRDGVWYVQRREGGFDAIQFGLPTDRLVPADYDGDGWTDIAVYRDGTWYVRQSQRGLTAFQFGEAADIPAPADYDGNGKADAAVFRSGTWFLRQESGGFVAIPFGLAGDRPLPSTSP